MIYDFDDIPQREGTSCYKYDMRQQVFGRADVIPMWIADMDFAVGPFIMEAIKNRAEHPVLGYDFRTDGFFESTRQWIARRSGWEISRDWIVPNPGVVAGLVYGELTSSDKGGKIVIQPPVYPPFARTVTENERHLVTNPLKLEGGKFVMDFDDLDKKLEGASAMILCNPHNPVGRVYTREELLRVGELCCKHDVIIISDEIHSDFIFAPGKHVHLASLSEEIASRTITLIAPSKTFNVAGLSTSLAIIPNAELRERFQKQLDRLHSGMGNTFGNIALEAAYTHGDSWIDQLNVYLRSNADLVLGFMKENLPSVRCTDPEGTFLMWLDFSSWGLSQKDLVEFLVQKGGLGLNNGVEFGREGHGHARMNIATSRNRVKAALEQLLIAAREARYDK